MIWNDYSNYPLLTLGEFLAIIDNIIAFVHIIV